MTSSASTKPDPDTTFRQWIFQRLDGTEWRDSEIRKAVYGHMSDAIDRMPVETFGTEVKEAYRAALSRITERLEAHADQSISLEDLAKSVDGGREIVLGRSLDPVGAVLESTGVHPTFVKVVDPTNPSTPPDPRSQDAQTLSQAALPVEDQQLKASWGASTGSFAWGKHRFPSSIAVAVLLLGSLIAVAILSFRSTEATCTPLSTLCFDSGWQPVSNKTTTAYFFRHKLGIAPRTLSVWFSPSANGETAFPLLWKFQRNEAGNPVSIEVKADVVLLNIWSGVPLFGSYNASTDRWTTYTEGYYRVVAEH